MNIKTYYNKSAQGVNYTREQASCFAKELADDFNPLHDIDAKRFCVPGDLLFATVLAEAGLSNNMTFHFANMVTDGIALQFPATLDVPASVSDGKDKEYLRVEASGEHSKDVELIESLVKAYVGFSGHTFPHILVELMAKQGVMINPKRPMLMYESMTISLDTLALKEVSIALTDVKLKVQEKRGNVCFEFTFESGGKVVGRGEKRMVLSGLRPYEKLVMDAVVAEYNQWKDDYARAS